MDSRTQLPVLRQMWARGSRCFAACTARAWALPLRSTPQALPWTRTPQRVVGALPSRIFECDLAGAQRWFATDVDDADIGTIRRRPRPRFLSLSVVSSVGQL